MGTDLPAEAAGHERSEEALQALAAMVRQDLRQPVLFILEVARPFHLLIQQAFYVAHPLLRPWLGDRLLRWANLLEDPEALERALRPM